MAPVTSWLRDIAARTGARAVDPLSTLCDGMICPATDADGLPRYIDSNHLRGFAASKHASFIDDMLLGGNSLSLVALPGNGSQGPLFKQ